MRNTRLVPGILTLVFAGLACSGTIAETGSGGGATTTTATTTTGIGGGTTATATTGVGGSTSVTTSGIGGSTSATTGAGAGAPSCQPPAACGAVDDVCLGLVDNSGKTTFGLRMSELDLSAPAALATGVVKTTIASDMTLAEPACNLDGAATFSWLLKFDTVAGTLETGGARPVADPTQGYAFDDEMITQGPATFHVQPITYGVTPDAAGQFSVTTGQDLVVPIFLNPAGNQVVLLPLRAARFTMGTLSASQDCIGSYNAASLQPSNGCQAEPPATMFTAGAALDGFIPLDVADSVIVSVLSETLCALLVGSPTYTMQGPSGVTVCARNANGGILFQGNWCSTTNAAATAACADSVSVGGTFAASSVLITN